MKETLHIKHTSSFQPCEDKHFQNSVWIDAESLLLSAMLESMDWREIRFDESWWHSQVENSENSNFQFPVL